MYAVIGLGTISVRRPTRNGGGKRAVLRHYCRPETLMRHVCRMTGVLCDVMLADAVHARCWVVDRHHIASEKSITSHLLTIPCRPVPFLSVSSCSIQPVPSHFVSSRSISFHLVRKSHSLRFISFHPGLSRPVSFGFRSHMEQHRVPIFNHMCVKSGDDILNIQISVAFYVVNVCYKPYLTHTAYALAPYLGRIRQLLPCVPQIND